MEPSCNSPLLWSTQVGLGLPPMWGRAAGAAKGSVMGLQEGQGLGRKFSQDLSGAHPGLAVENNMCPECNKQNANPNSWISCVQVSGLPV
jgi:hypothetical protein